MSVRKMFPEQWREELDMDVLDVSACNRESYETTPMTEEAFRIYNDGFFSTDYCDWRPFNR